MDAVTVRAAHRDTTGTVFTGVSYLRSVCCLGTSTAGHLEFRDGGASGTLLLDVSVPGNANNVVNIEIPGPGILFATDCHVTMPAGYHTTSFYGV
jgi:hypothetical protein